MSTQRQLEPFLRQATRGLWGLERRLVRAELEGHLRLRIDELQLSGLSPQAALERSLEELGHPSAISAGMRRVYVWPRLWPSLALLALALSLWLAWPHRPPEVATVPWQMDTPRAVRPTLVRLADVQANLKRQGLGLERIRIWSVGLVGLQFKEGELFARVVLQDAQEYLPLDDLVLSAVQQGIPFRLSGWASPSLQIGKTTLRLGGPVDPYSAYAYLARWAVLGPGAAPSLFRRQGRCVQQIALPDPPGTVYALLTGDPPPAQAQAIQPALEARITDVAAVAPNGLLTLHSRSPALALGSSLSHAKALLVRLSGRSSGGKVEYQILRPMHIQNLGCVKAFQD